MGLVIEHDGSGPGDVQENCCMCRTPTRYWYGKGDRNVALCPKCAKKTKIAELPTKSEWIAKERLLNPRLFKTFGW